MAKKNKEPDFSVLIYNFLGHVEDELITGEDRSSGPYVLEHMCEALRQIQSGVDPVKALGIPKNSGPKENRALKLGIAKRIHELRKNGDTWAGIEEDAITWPMYRDKNPLSQARLKNIYKEMKCEIEFIADLNELTESDIVQRIHEHLENGDTWPEIEAAAKSWPAFRRRTPPTKSTLKKLYNDKKDAVLSMFD